RPRDCRSPEGKSRPPAPAVAPFTRGAVRPWDPPAPRGLHQDRRGDGEREQAPAEIEPPSGSTPGNHVVLAALYAAPLKESLDRLRRR
ncbi:MAG TPA: hypothetical protein VGH38_05820, partial [Bryobacteraceae bacterium]